MGRLEDPVLRWSFLTCKASSGEDPTPEGNIIVNRLNIAQVSVAVRPQRWNLA